MTSDELGPASDAIAVVVLLGEVQPGALFFPAGRCPYCAEHVQMVSSSFRNLTDGKLHTCPLWIVKPLGRRYVHGEFTLLSTPTREPDGR